MSQHRTLAVIGVGLIGGSIGQAARQHGLYGDVVGIGRRESSLSEAREAGAVDRTTLDLREGVRHAEFVVVCAPVAAVADLVCQVAAVCPREAVITDAGSTKAEIVDEIERRLTPGAGGPHFVGSHPMAGDHRTGAANSRADLFLGRKVVITPTDTTNGAACHYVSQFWQNLGAETLEMDPATHDQAVAATSHLPHLVAYALAGATPEDVGPLAASGWRDTTRVAAAEPVLWQQIFQSNRAALATALQRFDDQLASLKTALMAGDDQELLRLLQEAKRIRDALGS